MTSFQVRDGGGGSGDGDIENPSTEGSEQITKPKKKKVVRTVNRRP